MVVLLLVVYTSWPEVEFNATFKFCEPCHHYHHTLYTLHCHFGYWINIVKLSGSDLRCSYPKLLSWGLSVWSGSHLKPPPLQNDGFRSFPPDFDLVHTSVASAENGHREGLPMFPNGHYYRCRIFVVLMWSVVFLNKCSGKPKVKIHEIYSELNRWHGRCFFQINAFFCG